MAEQEDRLKYEILTEIHTQRTRWLRNAMALVGLALAIGCTVAKDALIGGIVAGSIMFIVAVVGMVLSRKRTEKKEAESDV